MALYEHVFLARQDLAQAQVDALAETATKIVEDMDGKVTKVETWGLRSLAYKIAKNRKAHYSLMAIDAPPAAMAEVERQLSINEDVLRWLTVRVEELDLELSPLLARRERERERASRDDSSNASE